MVSRKEKDEVSKQLIDYCLHLPAKMTMALAAMTPLGSGPKRDHTSSTEIGMMTEADALHAALNGPPRKRKRTRKVQTDRKFECTFEGCGKSYSRAEHLYRHQLNRTHAVLPRACEQVLTGCRSRYPQADLSMRLSRLLPLLRATRPMYPS